MAISSWNAGIIRPVPVPPAGPYQDGAAPGVWTLDQVAFWTQQGLWPIAGNLAPIGLFAGGSLTSSKTNTIQSIVLATSGNASDFGDLTEARTNLGATASNTRGVWFGGQNTGPSTTNVIDYSTFSTAGNAIDFGDLVPSTGERLSASSNNVRGVVFGGEQGVYASVIQYITIASTGNVQSHLHELRMALVEVTCVTHHRWHLSVNVAQHDVVLRLYSG